MDPKEKAINKNVAQNHDTKTSATGKKKCVTFFDEHGAAGQHGGKKACYELIIPEGMSLNEAQQAIFEEQASELGLNNASAQRLLEMADYNARTHQDEHSRQIAAWAEEVRRDRELGGSSIQNTISYAKAGLARFDPEHKLYDVLQETGYANNPHVIRFLAAIGKAHMEDSVLFGKAAQTETARHERMYGKYNKE